MNKRVQELAEQAGMTKILNEHAHEYGNGVFENTPYPELKKFAELIVQDCIAQVALLGISNFENDDISWTVDMAIKNIRHRLGVE